MSEQDLPVEAVKLTGLQAEMKRLYENGLLSRRSYHRRLAAIKQKLAEIDPPTHLPPSQAYAIDQDKAQP